MVFANPFAEGGTFYYRQGKIKECCNFKVCTSFLFKIAVMLDKDEFKTLSSRRLG